MSATFHGSTEYIQQPDRREWDRSQGWQTVRTYIGPRDGALPFSATLQTDGAIKVTIADDGPTSTIAATYPDVRDAASVNSVYGTAQNVVWELDVQEVAKDLKTHKDIKQSGSAGQLDLAEAEVAVRDALPLDTNWTQSAKDLYALLTGGTTDYLNFYPVLRKTTKVTDSDGVKAALTGVGRAAAAPADCPQILWDNPVATPDNWGVEWLKKGPRVLDIGKGKFSIVEEWWGAHWSYILYGGNDTP